jgi:bacteriocin biosynthesis cyclodehydratase domain-containing protein
MHGQILSPDVDAEQPPNKMRDKSTTHSAVQVLSEGGFGGSVAAHLRHFFATIHHIQLRPPKLDVRSLPLEGSIPTVLAASRPLPTVCEALDQLAFSTGISFVPVILGSNLLTVGPVAGPGSQTCWSCWQKRCLQHSTRPEEEKEILHYYSNESSLGPSGFLEPFPFMAAARVAHILLPAATRLLASEVWQLKLYTREITIGASLGVHDCPQCGLHRPAISRTTKLLKEKVDRWWSGELT